MGQLDYGQLLGLAEAAGLSPAQAKTAAAIALAESGGRTEAHNPNPPDDSYGLWQINLYGPLRSRLAQYGLTDPSQLYDPMTNARAMAAISSGGQNWQPWSTFTSGAYQAFLGGAGDVGGMGPSAGPSSTPVADSGGSDCLIGNWELGGGGLFGGALMPSGPSFTFPCILTRSQAWGIVGGLAFAGGLATVLVGLVLVAGRALPSLPSRPRPAGGSGGARQTDESAINTADFALRDDANYQAAESARRAEQAGARRTIATKRRYYDDTDEEPF